jgi:hypothetical protein
LDIQPAFYWSTEHTTFLSIYIFSLLLLMIALGIIWGASFLKYKVIYFSSGKLASDYVVKTNLGTTLVNMGLIGLIALGYVHLVGGDINGAIVAGIFTVVGFGALGKHPRYIV